MKSIVSEKGQVTIPKPLRDRLGLREGQVLIFEEERGRLVATKEVTKSGIDAVYGMIKPGKHVDEIVEALRGPADE